jgi:16S rRNA (cytosine1402-N4)-methyltransferase
MIHVPVLPIEAIEMLGVFAGGVFVDGTLGAGGHTERIAKIVGETGVVIAFDRDKDAIDETESRLHQIGLRNIRYAHANFCFLEDALDKLGIREVDGILLDIGLSSDQLLDSNRGFSFSSPDLLDLRFDVTEGEPAWKLLERRSEKDIADVIFRYGEERHSKRIARAIVEQRRAGEPIRYASELAALVSSVVPAERRTKFGHTDINPATRTFQALRIAVNDELGSLRTILEVAPSRLKAGGRLVVISFHSLEDRIVKNMFRDDERLEVVTKKPLTATDEEIERNHRSRSAKMRAAKRV